MSKGCFITFEGIDGAGKSTQLEWVEQLLVKRGLAVTVTREPGGTALGEQLRNILLHSKESLLAETEALLMFAARREHIDKVIRPGLEKGEVVLCDRFTDATIAYQGGGSGVDIDKLEALERWVQGELQPDLTLYFDLPVEVAKQRIHDQRKSDRFERETEEFFERVRQAYLARARAHPRRIRVIDADAKAEVISQQIKDIVLTVCP